MKVKKKINLRKKITIFIGLILFINNMLCSGLLFFNYIVALSGFEIPIDNELVLFYFNDGLEIKLFFIGIVIGIITTLLGTLLVYYIMGKLLTPLDKLSSSMSNIDRQNIFVPIELKSDIIEIESLENSFNSMSNKIKKLFNNQANSSLYIAHEFRTPLAVMQTRIDVYKKQPNNNSEELISDISTQISKLKTHVTQILNLTNIQRLELSEHIFVNILLEEVTDNLEIIAEHKKVKLELNYAEPEDISLIVLGNFDLLYQAFYNLVENGIKYNLENGKVIISVSSFENKIIVLIKDTGPGIKEEDYEKIFYPFYRSKQKKENDVKGNGLGLAFSRQVFDSHKGSLKLKKTDKGTCFEVCMDKFCG